MIDPVIGLCIGISAAHALAGARHGWRAHAKLMSTEIRSKSPAAAAAAKKSDDDGADGSTPSAHVTVQKELDFVITTPAGEAARPDDENALTHYVMKLDAPAVTYVNGERAQQAIKKLGSKESAACLQIDAASVADVDMDGVNFIAKGCEVMLKTHEKASVEVINASSAVAAKLKKCGPAVFTEDTVRMAAEKPSVPETSV